jgi:glycosyltransferase involved in cell wall biosynthesis
MYLGEHIAVVVPAHDEAPHIRSVVETLPAVVDRAYVVDDASTDGTWGEIRAAVRAAPAGRTLAPTTTGRREDVTAASGGGADPADSGGRAHATGSGVADGGAQATLGQRLPEELPVKVPGEKPDPVIVAVRHGENRGRGAAIKTGYRLAMNDGMDVVAVMDGDGQMDPDQLKRVLHPVASGQADYAKGNRLDGPEYWREMSGWRLFGNVLLTGLTRVSSGYWGLRDPQNGYTAISRATLESLALSELYDDYGFLNDLLGELSTEDARVFDVALPAVYGDEDSGIRYSQFVPAVSMLLLVNFLRRLYVDGARRHRVGLPAAYGVAVVSWLGAVVAALTAALPGGTTVPVVLASVVGAAGPLPLAATGGFATAVAVALDRRVNAVLDGSDGRVADPR